MAAATNEIAPMRSGIPTIHRDAAGEWTKRVREAAAGRLPSIEMPTSHARRRRCRRANDVFTD